MVENLAGNPTEEQALKEVAFIICMSEGIPDNQAYTKAQEILSSRASKQTGSSTTCPLHWRFDSETFWHEPPSNPKIARIARGILGKGFFKSEPLTSRTFDMSVSDGKCCLGRLKHGDGQARGFGARLAWAMLVKEAASDDVVPQMTSLKEVASSLLYMPTVFDAEGNENPDMLVVRQAIRQDIRATMTQPLHALDWVGIALGGCKLRLGVSGQTTAQILATLERVTKLYADDAEIQAFDLQPVAKRARRGRRKATEAQKPAEETEGRLSLGPKRLRAIHMILEQAVPKSLELLRNHLLWCGDIKYSALNDDIFSLPFIWPGSVAPNDFIPSEVESPVQPCNPLCANNFLKVQLDYFGRLTEEQHLMILEKGLSIFEDEALHLPKEQDRIKHRADGQKWAQYRAVIVHWTQSIKKACQEDLPDDVEEIEKSVLYGDAMDDQILGVLRRFSPSFNVGMLPDIRAEFDSSPQDTAEREMMEAANRAWNSSFDVFSLKLRADWNTIKKVQHGSAQLYDILDWHEREHLREQVALAKTLSEQFVDRNFPKLTVKTWPDLPGQFSMASQALVREGTMSSERMRLVAIIDFNTPNSRDVLGLPKLAASLATLFKNCGPENCCLLVIHASLPKEEADTDAIDDEIAFRNIYKKAGFEAQTRARMLMTSQPGIEVQNQEAWQDLRICYLSQSDADAAGTKKPRTEEPNLWRCFSLLAQSGYVKQKPCIALPSEMVGADRIDCHTKAAQRGPGVAAALIQELLTPASSLSTSKGSRIAESDNTCLLDVFPWIGDRVLATLGFLKSEIKNYGILRHFVVEVTYKRLAEAARFTLQRVCGEVSRQWTNRQRVLHEKTFNSEGHIIWNTKQPSDVVPQPDESTLKRHPGAYQAWKGLNSLAFEVCYLHGPEIRIMTSKIQEFNQAPLDISEKVRKLELEHEDYKDLLAFMHASSQNKEDPEKDPRAGDPNPPLAQDRQFDFVTIENEQVLRQKLENSEECIAGDRHVLLIKDVKERSVYMLVKNDDHLLPANTVLGAFGGGVMCPASESTLTNIPFQLMQGDRSHVRLESKTTKEGKEVKEVKAQGTFYSVMKPFEKAAVEASSSLTLQGWGKILPVGDAGKHGYQLEFPIGHAKSEPQDYVPRNATDKVTSGNFFRSLACRSGWDGFLRLSWTLSIDTVKHQVEVRKPVVITSQDLKLEKGKPMKIWTRPT